MMKRLTDELHFFPFRIPFLPFHAPYCDADHPSIFIRCKTWLHVPLNQKSLPQETMDTWKIWQTAQKRGRFRPPFDPIFAGDASSVFPQLYY